MSAAAIVDEPKPKRNRRKVEPAHRDATMELMFSGAQSVLKKLSINRVYKPEEQALVSVTVVIDVVPGETDGYPGHAGLKLLRGESASIVEGKAQMKISLQREYMPNMWRFVDAARAEEVEAQAQVHGTPVASIVKGELRLRLRLHLTVTPTGLTALGWMLNNDIEVTTSALQQVLL